MERKKEKVIVLARVSTGLQDLDQQREVLIKAAKDRGYSDEQIIVIEDKESGTYLQEEERNGLNRLKETIMTDNVDLVIVYELSRIARVPKILYSVRDFLLEHKVQLTVLNPSFNLLKTDGTLDESSNVIFSLYVSMSENENYLRKARFARGKAKLFNQNRYCGGTTPYGYTMDPDYSFHINETEAEIIRYIFTEFISGKRTEDIGRSLIINGTWPDVKLNFARDKVRHILHNVIYCGRRSNENKYANKYVKNGYIYPAIISVETFDKADQAFSHRTKYNKIKTKHVYLCRGLIYTQDGLPFNVHYSHDAYARQISTQDSVTDFNLRISVIDAFVWELAKTLRLTKPDKPVETVKAELESKINELQFNLDSVDAEIHGKEEKIRRIEMRYLNGKITESDADRLQEESRKELNVLNQNRDTIRLNIQALKDKISVLLGDDDKASETALNLLTDEEKAVIVRQEIKQIIAVKNGPGLATLGVLTNEANDVILYRYVSRTRTVSRIDF